mmetsp:Transcript_21785/g.50183  ORF Transcript_21785/g.50183 Transcript_21785/m.50183 type:complete len:266 (-) Transcript_21785:612-1409(-)
MFDVLIYYGFYECCYLVVLRLMLRWIATFIDSNGWYDIGEGLFIFIFFTYLCYYVKLALTDDFYAEDATDVRCLKITPELIYCLQLYFSSNFADLPFFIGDAMAGRRPVKDTIIMIFHHALSSVCFFGGLRSQKMLFHAVYALVCEHTTVLVGARRIIIKMKNKKNSKLVNWLDTIIMGSYVRFRLYLFGMWFFYAWTDNSCLQHSDSAVEQALQMFYAPVIFFLLIISIWWLKTMLSKSGKRIATEVEKTLSSSDIAGMETKKD